MHDCTFNEESIFKWNFKCLGWSTTYTKPSSASSCVPQPRSSNHPHSPPEHPSNLIIISEHTSLWHYYNDCCSKIHNAPDSNTMFPLAAARRCWVGCSKCPASCWQASIRQSQKGDKQTSDGKQKTADRTVSLSSGVGKVLRQSKPTSMSEGFRSCLMKFISPKCISGKVCAGLKLLLIK